MIDLRDLRYFRLVVETGHMGKAAERAHRTQPAITKSIQRIEAELGAALFDRSQRKLTISPIGRLLLDRSHFLLREMDDLEREVREAAAGTAGHVRLGVSSTAAEFLLPHLTAELRRSNPGVTVDVTLGMNDSLATDLAAKKIDVVIGPATQVEPGLTFRRIVQDQVVVVADYDHPLCRQSAVKLADLQPYRWVLPSRSSATRFWLEQAFLKRGCPAPLAQIESNSISLTPRLILGTDLLSFISRRNLSMNALTKTLREVPVAETVMQRPFGVLTRADSYLSPAAESVRDLLYRRGRIMFMIDS